MLSKDDVDKMVRDAQEHAEEDKQRREEVETRNQAEQLAYQAERTLARPRRQGVGRGSAEVERQVDGAARGAQGLRHRGGEVRHGRAHRHAVACRHGGLPGRQPDGRPGPARAGRDRATAPARPAACAAVAPEGEPAGAGARSGGADPAPPDDAVEGEFKEV